MGLYAVKNDEGEWLGVDRNGSDHWQASRGDIYSGWFSANDKASVFGGHLVELVEAPAKVVVSEEEAEMLERAKNPTFRPSSVITSYSNDHDGWDITGDLEDRLIRAYVNGWTVEKVKRWNVKVPKKWSGDDKHYWTKEQDGALTWAYLINNEYMIPAQQFTLAEIEHYELGSCEKVEVSDDKN